MNVTLRQLAELIDGKLVGDGAIVIDAARPVFEAQSGHITFVENEKHVKHLAQCQASAVIAKGNHLPRPMPLIEVADPLKAFQKVFQHLHGRPEPALHGIDPKAVVHPTAQLGADVSLHPFVTIGEGTVIGNRCRLYPGVTVGRFCRLGDDVTLYPHVVLYDGCTLGNHVIIHANAVLGADGFGYRLQQGRHIKVEQLGSVAIGDDVEIGACTTIDRGTFQPTRVGEGTKMDNLVQVGHNCKIGNHNLLVSQVGIAGSCTTGDYVVMAGQAGLADHIRLGDRAIVGAKAGVLRDVEAGQHVLGAPAMPEREFKVMALTMMKLPAINRTLKRVLKHLGLSEDAA